MLDVRDADGKWLVAEVKQIRAGSQVEVFFELFRGTRFETETIDAELHVHRFAPLGSRTMAGKTAFRIARP